MTLQTSPRKLGQRVRSQSGFIDSQSLFDTVIIAISDVLFGQTPNGRR